MKLKCSHGLLIILLIIAIPIFGHLDELPIQVWDESRLAENALEMNHDGNYIVTHFAGTPDMWNTKPPLMIWLQVLCIKLLGMGELAIRLPSALAALATCLLLYWLLGKKLNTPWLGVLSCIVLITSAGFVRLHGTRTGDYDALLTLFTTACAICFYLYLEEGKGKYLTYTIATLTLACLTKGIAGLLLLPALFLYILYKRKLPALLGNKRLYIGLAGFVVFAIGYYLLREHYNHGYLQAIQDNELGGRYNQVNEHHTGGSYFYLNLLTDEHFKSWYLMIIPGILFGTLSNKKWLKDLTVFMSLLVITYLCVLSSASTKISWYDVPIYPFLAIIVAVFIYHICLLLAGIKVQDHFSRNPLPYIFIVLVCLVPYCTMLMYATTRPQPEPWDVENTDIAQYLKDALHGVKNIDGCTVTDALSQNIYCYETMFKYMHKPVTFIYGRNFNDAKKVIAYTSDTKKYIDSNYYSHVLNTYNCVVVYQIDSVRHHIPKAN